VPFSRKFAVRVFLPTVCLVGVAGAELSGGFVTAAMLQGNPGYGRIDVELICNSPTCFLAPTHFATGDDGAFSIHVPPGNYTLIADSQTSSGVSTASASAVFGASTIDAWNRGHQQGDLQPLR
jgi:hypothetical protein